MSFKASSYQKKHCRRWNWQRGSASVRVGSSLCAKDPLSCRGSKKCCGSAIAVRTSLVVSVVSH